MRIIAGDLKGRKLQTPKDSSQVRPTTDKVKEGIFNTIAQYIEDAVIVDLFCGTGNLGLEAISRGAKFCYFADKSRLSLALAKTNADHCKVLDQSAFIQGDFIKVLEKIEDKVDIFFLDPPYEGAFMMKAFQAISEKKILAQGGIILAEHGKREILPDEVFGFIKQKEKRYGSIMISIFQ
ncbi:MAG: 16S rRNA (guanine(966)-N(2))-methyltransferase RsmD [Anaerovorax sp.]